MWGFDTIIKVVTYVRGGEVTVKLKNASEQMEAVSDVARNGQRTEKVVSKLNKTSLTYKICSKGLSMIEEDLDI